jgi:hypothetical protein
MAGAQAWIASGSIVNPDGLPISDVRIEVRGSFRKSTSMADGSFTLGDLTGDTSVLVLRRLGYAPGTVAVPRGQGSPLRIVMEPLPLSLSGVIVPGDAAAPRSQTVTRESVRNLPALGEADILRMLPFMGGVSQPNDMISVAHLAGSAADEVSLIIDGHPVQSPVHFGGMFSGINVAAIERVDVFAAHASTEFPSRLGGLLDIRTRRADVPQREAALSLLSSGVTVATPAVAPVSILASGRVTYLDRALRVLHVTSVTDEVSVPSYADALLRLQFPVARAVRVEPLLFLTEDRHRVGGSSSAPTVVREGLIGLSASHSGSTWTSRLRMSRDVLSIGNPERVRGEKRIDVKQAWTSLSAGSVGDARGYRLTGRLSLDQRAHHLAWQDARFRDELGTGLPDSSNAEQSQRVISGLIEASRYFSRATILSAGNRVYATDGKLFHAPSIRAEWSRQWLTLVASADRRYQFDAEYRPRSEETIAPPVFLFDDPRWSDGGGLTARATRQHAGRIASLELSGYARKVYQRPIGLDTRVTRSDSAQFLRSSGKTIGATSTISMGSAQGMNLQATYTLQRVYTREGAGTRPSDWDIPHSLAIFAGLPLSKTWSLTSALQWHSGLAVTPVASVTYVPFLREGVEMRPRLLYGPLNDARLPSYRRVDLGVRRTWHVGQAEWTLSGQVVNALATDNVFGYDWQEYVDALAIGRNAPASRPGLPLVPSLGIAVRW